MSNEHFVNITDWLSPEKLLKALSECNEPETVVPEHIELSTNSLNEECGK